MEQQASTPDADWQQQLAALRAERDAALAQRSNEYSERAAHQAATIDVLKAMSASPGDPQPVFDLIAMRARELCAGEGLSVFEYDGTLVYHRAITPDEAPDAAIRAFDDLFPMAPTRGSITCRAILDGRIVHVRDIRTEDVLPELLDLGYLSQLVIPLVRDAVVIGAITLTGREAGGFSDTQVELLQTFAEQAVIAITSAETYRALQARTRDLQESLEQQTATAEVMGVINASPGNLAPVFGAMLEKMLRLCESACGALLTYGGENFDVVAMRGVPPLLEEVWRQPQVPAPGTALAALVRGDDMVHNADITDTDAYRLGAGTRRAYADLGGARSAIWMALRKDGVLLGAVTIYRQEVRPYADSQVALLRNFAAQAVIAMENARLITEQREALEQQTAMAEVLGVINASAGELAPVFDAVLEKGLRLAEAAFGALWVYEGNNQRAVAARGMTPVLAEFRAANPVIPFPPIVVQMIETKRSVQQLDVREGDGYRSGQPSSRAVADLGGARTMLAVPLIKEDTVIGNVQIYRQEVRAFTDKQIALLENFAAQAVIAMENARLITEQREALERQTAMAEVLEVINASQGDLQPVFQTMLNRALQLCEATVGEFLTYGTDGFQIQAASDVPEEFIGWRRENSLGPMLEELRVGASVQSFPDLMETERYRRGDPNLCRFVEMTGARSAVAIALRKDGRFLGMMGIGRREVRPFDERHISILKNFAAQAVIAMENARLLTEQREALEQQTATAEVLRVINASPGILAPVFDTILDKAMRLCGVAFGNLNTWDGESIRNVANRGLPPALAEWQENHPVRTPGAEAQALIETRRSRQVLDAAEGPGYLAGRPGARAMVDLGGARTSLFVPLLSDESVLGFLHLFRQEVRAFTDKEINLLQNFAAQAVIAMENARLITEQREALERQTATAEVLGVINASPGYLAPVFDAILDKAMRQCGAAFGVLDTWDGARRKAVATRGLPDALAAFMSLHPETWAMTPMYAELLETKQPAHRLDVMAGEAYRQGHPVVRALCDLGGARTFLIVPLLKDGTVLGNICVYRQEIRAFTDKQIALLENSPLRR